MPLLPHLAPVPPPPHLTPLPLGPPIQPRPNHPLPPPPDPPTIHADHPPPTQVYRMNVPMFAPDLELLIKWEQDDHVMTERIYWQKATRPHRYANTTNLSPNSRARYAALRHWLALCDVYQFPNITYFASVDDLMLKIRSAPLEAISADMARFNARQLEDVRGTWRRIFECMFHGMAPGGRQVPSDYEGALTRLYGPGVVPSAQEPPCARESRPELGEWG